MLDVVLAPSGPLEAATDVPGRVSLAQGGSAATTARWAARLGADSTLVCAVGRDAPGGALVGAMRAAGVTVRAVRVRGERTGRIGVLVAPGGERSFVADRAAADRLTAEDLRPAWFRRADVLHLPVYSLLGPLGDAGRRAVSLVRSAGGLVSLDLASVGPLLAGGRRAAQAVVRGAAPDLLFATLGEAEALGGGRIRDLSAFAPVVVVKRGARGATVLAASAGESVPFDVATPALEVADTTGAGDAFDAGFLVTWIQARSAGRTQPVALREAALGGHRAAARQIARPRPELWFG